jgi:hypothetical protein
VVIAYVYRIVTKFGKGLWLRDTITVELFLDPYELAIYEEGTL